MTALTPRWLLFLFLGLSFFCWAQQGQLEGKVVDEAGQAIFAANIYIKDQPELGTISDIDGNFSLKIPNTKAIGALIVSSPGYREERILIERFPESPLHIVLTRDEALLDEVVVKGRNPISEEFSVIQLDKFDIYTNPESNADPLKAIITLPASSNTDETANPSLRGSDASRSRVIFNEVPILNPVRSAQLSGLDNFSLFNAEIIGKQYIYASNPPLTYGNSSAGLIEIQTIPRLRKSGYQFSLGLAGLGFFASHKFDEKQFLQLYGNYQFSGPFIKLNAPSFNHLRSFGKNDFGMNFHQEFKDQTRLNLYSYVIKENYEGVTALYNYAGAERYTNLRQFNILNLKEKTNLGLFSLNGKWDLSQNHYRYGNLSSRVREIAAYASLNYAWIFPKNKVQWGIAYEYNQNQAQGTAPTVYYALRPGDASENFNLMVDNHNLEAYSYSTWRFFDNWFAAAAIRSNIPFKGQKGYLSRQGTLRYEINDYHRFLLSGGRYHNYAPVNYYNRSYVLLKSYQIALDYIFEKEGMKITLAPYYKKEYGDQTIERFIPISSSEMFGLEFFYQQKFLRHWDFSLANTYLRQNISVSEKQFKGEKDLNYFLKISLSYTHPRLFNASLSYNGRPGTRYTSIARSQWDAENEVYQPFFNDTFNDSRYPAYNKLNFTINKLFSLGKNTTLIAYFSVNNILNAKIPRKIIYNPDYSSSSYEYFQMRTFYMGAVLRFE